MRYNGNPTKRLAASISGGWYDDFDIEDFSEKWDRGEENAVLRVAKDCGHLSRDNARNIINALDRYRARRLENASPHKYEPEPMNLEPDPQPETFDGPPAELPGFRQPPAEAGEER